MIRLYLVRHGKAAAGFDEELDPPLDAIGREQAAAMARLLAPLGPLDLISSPMRRCRETAAALAQIWGAPARIDKRVTEAPTPGMALAERRRWIGNFMQAQWTDPAAASHLDWRRRLLGLLDDIAEDTVIASHFIAINVLTGAVQGDKRVVCFRPDNASVTRLEKHETGWRLGERGRQIVTEVL